MPVCVEMLEKEGKPVKKLVVTPSCQYASAMREDEEGNPFQEVREGSFATEASTRTVAEEGKPNKMLADATRMGNGSNASSNARKKKSKPGRKAKPVTQSSCVEGKDYLSTEYGYWYPGDRVQFSGVEFSIIGFEDEHVTIGDGANQQLLHYSLLKPIDGSWHE